MGEIKKLKKLKTWLYNIFRAKMASAKQNYKSGQAHGQGQAKTEEWVQSTKDTANTAKDRTASAAQSAKDRTASVAQSAQESAQHGKDQSAVDSVKNTIGMAENNAKK